jgi:hypothetical protein
MGRGTTDERDRRLNVKRWLWLVLFAGLTVLAVGCSAADPASIDVSSADDVRRIRPREAKALLDSGEAILVDTRSSDSYETQHAAGAISFPEEQVAIRFDELPADGEEGLIFYCT